MHKGRNNTPLVSCSVIKVHFHQLISSNAFHSNQMILFIEWIPWKEKKKNSRLNNNFTLSVCLSLMGSDENLFLSIEDVFAENTSRGTEFTRGHAHTDGEWRSSFRQKDKNKHHNKKSCKGNFIWGDSVSEWQQPQSKEFTPNWLFLCCYVRERQVLLDGHWPLNKG